MNSTNSIPFPTRVIRIKATLLGSTARKGYISLVDQALVSGVNFLTVIILARYMTSSDYGVFVLAFGIYLLVNNVQMALITTPMTVLSAPLDEEQLRGYLSSLGLIQIAFGGIITAALLIVVVLLYFLSFGPVVLDTFIGMALAVFAFQGQAFFRRILFARIRPEGAFLNDMVSYGLQLTGMIALYKWGILSGRNAFFVIGLTSGMAIIVGLWQCRKYFSLHFSSLGSVLHENFNYGKWMLLSFLSQWVSSQSYLFILAAFLSTAATGVFDACLKILAVTNILLLGMDNFVVSVAAKKLEQEGLAKMKKIISSVYIVGGVGMAVYCGIAAIFPETLLKLFYGHQYSGYGNIVMIFALLYFVAFFNQPPTMGLKALKKPEKIFYGNLIAASITLLLAVPLVKYYGIYGACVGMILTRITWLIAFSYFYRCEIKKRQHALSETMYH